VPFFAPCMCAMMAFTASHPTGTGPVFLNGSGKPWQSKSFQHEFSDYAKSLGIEGLHFHDLRGTVQTALGEAGLSDLQISSITGHKLKEKNQILGSYASRTKLMFSKVAITFCATRLADIGVDLVASTVNQTVNRAEIIPLKPLSV
jgi:hypothetical protein